jgi:hypothetical protein
MYPNPTFDSLRERLRSSDDLDSPCLRSDVESGRRNLPGCDSPDLKWTVPEGTVRHLSNALCTYLLQYYRQIRMRSLETVRVAC